MLSLESFSRLHFSDGRVRPEFRQKLLDRGVTPQHAFEKQKETPYPARKMIQEKQDRKPSFLLLLLWAV